MSLRVKWEKTCSQMSQCTQMFLPKNEVRGSAASVLNQFSLAAHAGISDPSMPVETPTCYDMFDNKKSPCFFLVRCRFGLMMSKCEARWREVFTATVWSGTFSDSFMDQTLVFKFTCTDYSAFWNVIQKHFFGSCTHLFLHLCVCLLRLSDEQLLGAAEPPGGDLYADIRRAHLSGSDHIRRGSKSVNRKGLRCRAFCRQLNSHGNFIFLFDRRHPLLKFCLKYSCI